MNQPLPQRVVATEFVPARRVHSFGTTVFAEFTALAIRHNAVNLGQGFPDFPAPDFIKEAAAQAVHSDLNQYTRSAGHLRLVRALAQLYGPLFQRDLDPLAEIVVTTGATEGIFATMQALIDPGDEVILLEPFYDSYPAAVIMAGGRPVYVPLHPPPAGGRTRAAQWRLDMQELAAAFSERTRLLVINTPNNPTGKVFNRAELEAIADLVRGHSRRRRHVSVLCDEVYEWMVFDGSEHVRMATLPGMWQHTITLGSAGKTFSVTGWKIGWTVAPPAITRAILMAHQWIPFTVATPLQEATAVALEQSPGYDYFTWLSQMYQQKRNKLVEALDKAGLTPVIPQGSYFVLADTSRVALTPEPGHPDSEPLRDVAMCRWLTREVGVAAIPPSAFYSTDHQHMVSHLARFCFCKSDDVLVEGSRRLEAMMQP